nr:hypothetical protein [Tanacetum cinerariifolium]
GDAIRTFVSHIRPLIIIDSAHIKASKDESSESDDESSESDEEGSESDEDEEATPIENKNCK